MRTLFRLFEQNRAWAAKRVAADPGYFGRLARIQAPDNASISHRYVAMAGDAAHHVGTSQILQFTTWAAADAKVGYGGIWAKESAPGFYRGSTRYASASGRTAQATFKGVTDVAWVSTKAPNRGKAKVFIDGSVVATVDLFAPTLRRRQVVFTTALAVGEHTIKVKVLGSHRAGSSGNRVDVDALLGLHPAGVLNP